MRIVFTQCGNNIYSDGHGSFFIFSKTGVFSFLRLGEAIAHALLTPVISNA